MYDELVLEEIAALGDAIAAANCATQDFLTVQELDDVLRVERLPGPRPAPAAGG